jgi:hypothetical protein
LTSPASMIVVARGISGRVGLAVLHHGEERSVPWRA